MQEISVFEFTRFSDYFASYCRNKKRYDGTFSFRRLARKAGMRSPSLLAMIAKGDRTPTPGCLMQLSRALELKKNESEYAAALVGMERASSDEERLHYQRKMNAFRPKHVRAKTRVDLDSFELICRWHHVAILEMTDLEDFREDPHWVSVRLGGEIGVRDVQEALERLQRLGLLAKDSTGRLRKSSGLETVQGVPSQAIRSFHRAQLEKAAVALEKQSVTERLFQGHTISIDPKRLEEIQALFQLFLKKVEGLFEQTPRTETYHLAFQMFRLTDKTKDEKNA